MPSLDDKTPPLLKLFRTFGTHFEPTTGDEAVADACPFCGKERKCYLNTTNGLYDCKSCGESGNATTYIRHVHRTAVEATTDSMLRALRQERDYPLQTLKRFGVAWNDDTHDWLLPAMSVSGEVNNLVRYRPGRNPNKLNLPGLPACLFGLHQLGSDPSKMMFVTEGFFDTVAADHQLRATKVRNRYDVVGVPSAGIFKPEWGQHFKGRKVVFLYDNDNAGVEGQKRAAKMIAELAKEVLILRWPEGDDYPEKCDVSDLVKQGVGIVEFAKKHAVTTQVGKNRLAFVRGDKIVREPVKWLWNERLQFGTFVSVAGLMGTHKSGIIRDLSARATAGKPFPLCDDALPPMDVLYLTSEDSEAVIVDLVELAGGDLTRLHIYDIARDLEPADILERMGELEALINELKAGLVVLDAFNSFAGGDISTDAKARRTLSGRFQSLARRTGACIVGIRNWGRGDSSQTSQQRALGATSLSDVARCVLNTVELPRIDADDDTEPRAFELNFEKVSNAPPQAPIKYEVQDLRTPEQTYLRKIVWRKPITDFKTVMESSRAKKVAEKGSTEKVAMPFRVVGGT